MRRIKKFGKYISTNKPYLTVKIIWIPLILIGIGFLVNSILLEIKGIGFLVNSIPLNIKIGFMLIIIGILIIFITKGKLISKNVRDVQITIVAIAWILLMFFITNISDLEIFFILILIGLLLLKEITDDIISLYLKKRMNVLISAFVIGFIAIMGKTIINI